MLSIAKENKTDRNFFIQRGFITVTDKDNNIIAVSSGWEVSGQLMVYRPSENGWEGNWEDEETFPVEVGLNLQNEFQDEERYRLNVANVILAMKEIPDIKEIAEDVCKELEYEMVSSEIVPNDEIPEKLHYELTRDFRAWQKYCFGGEDNYMYNREVWNHYTWTNIIPPRTTKNGVQWCLYNYRDDSFCSSPSYDYDCVCIYVPNEYGTENEELIKIMQKYGI